MQQRSTEGEPTAELPREVPLFPLPDHVLLPGVEAPYRVFEPRYRILIEELMEQPPAERWISVPRLAPGWKQDYHASPAIHELATVGRITSCEALSGGHYFIGVEGIARCRLFERPTDRPFRVARIEAVPDLPSEAQAAQLRDRWDTVIQAVYALSQLLGTTAEDLANAASSPIRDGLMSYRLASGAIDTADDRQAVLEERQLDRRLDQVLDALTGLVGLASRHVGGTALA